LPERRAAVAKWADYLDRVLVGEILEIGQRDSNVVARDGASRTKGSPHGRGCMRMGIAGKKRSKRCGAIRTSLRASRGGTAAPLGESGRH
jgi:hypothetical protein